MALYLFLARHEAWGTDANPEYRMVLKPFRGQTTYVTRRNRYEDLGVRRLQLNLEDRARVCRRGPGIVYVLWQPGDNIHSANSAAGRLPIHSRNGEEHLVYGAGFKLVEVGNYGGPMDGIGIPTADRITFYDDTVLSRCITQAGLTAVDSTLRDLKTRLLEAFQNLVPTTAAHAVDTAVQTASADTATAGNDGAAADDDDDIDIDIEKRIRHLQGVGIDYSMIVSENRKQVFEVLDKMAVGPVEFDYYKADGSLRHARGTRNPELIARVYAGNPVVAPDNVSTNLLQNREREDSQGRRHIYSISYYDYDCAAFRSFIAERLLGVSLRA